MSSVFDQIDSKFLAAGIGPNARCPALPSVPSLSDYINGKITWEQYDRRDDRVQSIFDNPLTSQEF